MSVNPEALAVEKLRAYLLAKLPARATAINATRAAAIRAPLAGPYVIGASSKVLAVSLSREGALTEVTLTTGTRTAAQVAAEVGAGVAGVTATADGDHLLITSDTAPAIGATLSADTSSSLRVGAPSANSANAVFGFEANGYHVVRSPIRAPGLTQFRDGTNTPPDGKAGAFWVVVQDRTTTITPDMRQQRDEYNVTLRASLFCPSGTAEHRSRDRIMACVQAVREVLTTAEGRALGAGSSGVALCLVQSVSVLGDSFAFTNERAPNASFDVATMTLLVRIYQTPIA